MKQEKRRLFHDFYENRSFGYFFNYSKSNIFVNLNAWLSIIMHKPRVD